MQRNDRGKNTCGMTTPETLANPQIGPSNRSQANLRRDNTGLPPLISELTDGDRLPREGVHQSDTLSTGLDRIMDRFDKLDSRMDYSDRRFERLEHKPQPDTDPPDELDDYDDLEFRPHRRYERPDRGRGHPRNFNHGYRDRGGANTHRRPGFRDDVEEFLHDERQGG